MGLSLSNHPAIGVPPFVEIIKYSRLLDALDEHFTSNRLWMLYDAMDGY